MVVEKQPCALQQEQGIHRDDDPERAVAREDVEEQSGGQVVCEARCGAQDMAVACRDGWVEDVEGRRGSRREDGLREVQREAIGMDFGEAVLSKAARRTTRKTVMHVGGWDLLGCEGRPRVRLSSVTRRAFGERGR